MRKTVLGALLVVFVLGVGAGPCATLPMVTTTAPDGTVTQRVDTEAINAIVDQGVTITQTLLTQIQIYKQNSEAARLAGKQAEAEKWDKLIALAQEMIVKQSKKTVEDTTPIP